MRLIMTLARALSFLPFHNGGVAVAPQKKRPVRLRALGHSVGRRPHPRIGYQGPDARRHSKLVLCKMLAGVAFLSSARLSL